jgi:hypothetical protein
MEAVMTNQEIRKYQMLGRVRDFGAAHRDLFPARSVAGKLFAAVAAAAEALQQHETTESAGRGGEQEGAASKAAARAALRRQVGAIAHTARAAEVPGLGGKFRALLSCNDERLLSQARTFLKEAKPFAETFVAHELPSNFLRQLQAAIDAFEQAMQVRASGRDQRVGARARIDASMKTALHAVRRLNAIVPNRLDDPAAVALWNMARRVDAGRVKSDEAAVPNGSEPSSSPAQPHAVNPAA